MVQAVHPAVIGCIGLAFGLLIGGLIAYYATPSSNSPTSGQLPTAGQLTAAEKDWVTDVLEKVDPTRLEDNLRELTKEPHLAGSRRDIQLAEMIRDRFQEAGFDWVKMIPSRFLLSRPDPNNPNSVRVLNSRNRPVFTSNYKERPLHPDDEDPNFIHAFNAYTPALDILTRPGEAVVYANYGRIEDFKQLQRMGVEVNGKIVIMRYGKIFRGNKVNHASQYGAIGAILFSDPQDVAQNGTEPQDVYPYTTWLPGTGIQRGTTFLGDGDPLTPGWPSTEHAYRVSMQDAGLPVIPCQPIGYEDAKFIMSMVGGSRAPEDWQGGIPGVIYALGPHFRPGHVGYRVRLSTHNSESIVTSHNVIASIKGSEEPDRYVLIGNHRDAWGYGAADPSSGTAQLLETARVLGEKLKDGWRPHRTIVFCSWGAEEYGLIGSTEWVEEHIDKLQGRAVAYINTDTCTAGPELKLRASPVLWRVMKDVTKLVPGVKEPRNTLYQEWTDNHKKLYPDETELPVIKTLGSGSDHAHFQFYAGVPSMDISFARHKGQYPAYHTGYETFFLIANLTDPGFAITQGCSRLASIMLKSLADARVLPFSLSSFPDAMLKVLSKFALPESGIRDKLLRIYPKFIHLEESVHNLQSATASFQKNITRKEAWSDLEARAVNDQLMKFERAFIMPGGLPGRPITRHAIFAASQFDSYATAGFPGLTDLLHDYDALPLEQKARRNEDIKRHISDLTIMTDRATGLLNEVHVF